MEAWNLLFLLCQRDLDNLLDAAASDDGRHAAKNAVFSVFASSSVETGMIAVFIVQDAFDDAGGGRGDA